MPQDTTVQERYEHEQAMRRAEREEAELEGEIVDARLHAGSHPHQDGLISPGAALRTRLAADIKEAHDLLPDFHRDELRLIPIVEPGALLQPGDVFIDLRDRARGELVARGEETVSAELLVPKNGTGYVIWNKLLGVPASLEPSSGGQGGDQASQGAPDPLGVEQGAPASATINAPCRADERPLGA